MAVTGEGRDLIEFTKRHPAVIWQITLVILVGTLGQVFISAIITSYGSLPLSLVTSTRKFFTILISVAVLGNSVSTLQWLATGIIFSALSLDALIISRPISKNESEDKCDNVVISSNDESEPIMKRKDSAKQGS